MGMPMMRVSLRTRVQMLPKRARGDLSLGSWKGEMKRSLRGIDGRLEGNHEGKLQVNLRESYGN
jgi:hypothetical protein